MNRHRSRPCGRALGFTLIELILVIVVLAIASVGIISLNANIFSGQTTNTSLQIGTALMQDCAELILAKRERDSDGINAAALAPGAPAAAATTLCSGATVTVSGTAYPAPIVTITAGNSGTGGMSACPYTTGTDCKLVSIQQGSLTPITLLLAK